MKRNKFFKTGGLYLALIMLVASFSLTSCLKDNGPGSVNFGKSPALVAFQYAGIGNVPYIEAIHNQSTVTTNVEVSLSVASITQSTPVTGTVVVDPDSSAAYMKANSGTNILPTSLYSIANGGKFTIAAGKQFASIPITLAGDKIDFSKNYFLVLKITGASGAQLTSNLNYATVQITLLSVYAGSYTVTGSFVDKVLGTSATPITDDGIYPYPVTLVTQSAYSVAMYDPAFGYYHEINSNGTTSVYGNFAPVFNFDPAGSGKILSVTNYSLYTGNSQGRDAQIDPTGTNAVTTGTPGTSGFTFQVSYQLTVGGSARTYFKETFTLN